VAEDVLTDWRAAWRSGLVDDRLGTTLALLEQITIASVRDPGTACADAHRAGVQPRALVSAGYINFGFNVITRIADGVGVALPEAADLKNVARLLLAVGYRALAARPFASGRPDFGAPDPFRPLVDRLREAALRGRAALAPDLRQALYEGTASGRLGDFGQAVAEQAWTITRADVDALRREELGDDELFETTICSALGAATRRLAPLIETIRMSPAQSR